MLRVGETILLQNDAQGTETRLVLLREILYDNRIFHIFEPTGAPLHTNLIVMEYVGGAYIPVTVESELDAALHIYFKRC